MTSHDNSEIFNNSSVDTDDFVPITSQYTPPINSSMALDFWNHTPDYHGYCQDGNCEFNINQVYEKLRQDDFKNILIITILLALLGCVGSLGNLFVLLVFSQRFTQQTSTYFILSLAAIDLVICSLVIPGVIVKSWYHQFYFDWLCKAWEMLRMYSLPTSAFLLVAIAFDRYFLICMATNGLMTRKRAKIIIAVTVGLGLALSIPPLLAVGVYEIDDDGTKTYRGICIENYGLITVEGLHQYWIFITALFGVMIVTIATLYTMVFLTVYGQSKKWKRLRNNRINLTISEDDDALPQQSSSSESETTSANTISRKGKRGREIKTRQSRRFSEAVLKKVRFWDRSEKDNNTVFFIRVNPADDKTENRQNRRRSARPDIEANGRINGKISEGKLLTTTSLTTMTTSSDPQSVRQVRQPKRSVITLAESSERSQFQYRAHIKTAQVLFTVTLVYVISFLPTFLVTYQLIPNEVVFYVYFVNNVANPIIYSFMNKKFRSEVAKTFAHLSSVCTVFSQCTKK